MKPTIFLLALLLSSCCHGDRPPRPERPPRPDRPERPDLPPLPPDTVYLHGSPVWSDMDDVRNALGGLATFSGTHVNLNGNAISGREIDHPETAQDEDAIPLVIDIEGFRLENGIIRDIPGGIVAKANNNVFKALTFIESGEDFLSTSTNGASGLSVWNCRFLNDRREDADKSLQANSAVDASIKDNYFTGGITAIRLGSSKSDQRDVRCEVEGNTFEKVSTAVNISGHTTAYARGNSFLTVRHRWVVGDDASVEYR